MSAISNFDFSFDFGRPSWCGTIIKLLRHNPKQYHTIISGNLTANLTRIQDIVIIQNPEIDVQIQKLVSFQTKRGFFIEVFPRVVMNETPSHISSPYLFSRKALIKEVISDSQRGCTSTD